MKCKHCEVDFDLSVGKFANHVRWCDKNPKIKEYKADNSLRGKKINDEKFGIHKNFTVVCASCNKEFVVKERELLFPRRKIYFCTRNCANSIGGKAKSAKHHYDEVANYATVAWRHHKRECLVCGENRVVAAHHMDENHDNNDPQNLVPLCPTHHHYMHSKHKEIIVEKVIKYINNKWK
jgi:hypothetical protein